MNGIIALLMGCYKDWASKKYKGRNENGTQYLASITLLFFGSYLGQLISGGAKHC